jgi:hypothetical protein
MPLQKSNAEALFQLSNLNADRRLRDLKEVGSLCDVAEFNNMNEVLELTQGKNRIASQTSTGCFFSNDSGAMASGQWGSGDGQKWVGVECPATATPTPVRREGHPQMFFFVQKNETLLAGRRPTVAIHDSAADWNWLCWMISCIGK